jgi:hypothetical protein
MPLRLLHISGDSARPWSVTRGALYGAGIGAFAAVFRLIAPWHEPHTMLAMVWEIAVAAFAFALLCAIAAALRNYAASRLV